MIIARQPRRSLGDGIVTGAATGALAYSNPVSGAIAAGTSIIANLLSCGTIGSAGCDKEHDASLQMQGMAQMRRLAYAAESGQMDPQQAIQQIGALGQQIQNGYVRKSSGDNVTPNNCAADAANAGIPASSRSAQAMCDGTHVSLSQFTSNLQALVASVGQAAPQETEYIGSAATAQAIANQMGAPPGGVLPNPQPTGPSLTTIAVIGAAGLFAFMALR